MVSSSISSSALSGSGSVCGSGSSSSSSSISSRGCFTVVGRRVLATNGDTRGGDDRICSSFVRFEVDDVANRGAGANCCDATVAFALWYRSDDDGGCSVVDICLELERKRRGGGVYTILDAS